MWRSLTLDLCNGTMDGRVNYYCTYRTKQEAISILLSPLFCYKPIEEQYSVNPQLVLEYLVTCPGLSIYSINSYQALSSCTGSLNSVGYIIYYLSSLYVSHDTKQDRPIGSFVIRNDMQVFV